MNNDSIDYYAVLGVSKNDDSAKLKSAYRELAKKYHPDANQGDKKAEEMFKKISEAYAILSDPEKRAEYDRHGHGRSKPGYNRSQAHGSEPWSFSGSFDNFANFDFDDIFDKVFGGVGRNKTKTGNGRDGKKTTRGIDVAVGVTISPSEATSKIQKEVSYSYPEPCCSCKATSVDLPNCEKCNGTGRIRATTQSAFGKTSRIQTCPSCGGSGANTGMANTQCTNCKGSGYVNRSKLIEVTIPVGIRNGQTIRIKAWGALGKTAVFAAI